MDSMHFSMELKLPVISLSLTSALLLLLSVDSPLCWNQGPLPNDWEIPESPELHSWGSPQLFEVAGWECFSRAKQFYMNPEGSELGCGDHSKNLIKFTEQSSADDLLYAGELTTWDWIQNVVACFAGNGDKLNCRREETDIPPSMGSPAW